MPCLKVACIHALLGLNKRPLSMQKSTSSSKASLVKHRAIKRPTGRKIKKKLAHIDPSIGIGIIAKNFLLG